MKEQRDDLKKVEMLTLKRVEGVEAEDGGEASFNPEEPTLACLWQDGLGDTEVRDPTG